MKKTMFFFFWLAGLGMWAQPALMKTSLSSGGGTSTTGSTNVIYTLGENFVAEADAGTIHLSEGFIGPDIAAIMGLDEYQPLKGVKVYPNPVKDVLRIQLPAKSNYEIRLFDMTGKIVLNTTTEFKMWSLNMKNLRSGFYILNIIDRTNKRYTNIKIRKI